MKRMLMFLSVCLASTVMNASSVGINTADVMVLCYHDVRDNVGTRVLQNASTGKMAGNIEPGTEATMDTDQYATSTRNLAAHFDWLKSHGYNVISVQQLIDARSGRGGLPQKAVLLTFDDGLRSVYTKVFPLLKAYHYPAVVAVVGAWVDLTLDDKVDYGPRPFLRGDFVTWDQLREMQDSGLVEIASHTYDQHHGVLANPQENLIPAVITHAYRPKTHNYETDEEYKARLRADLTHSYEEIREKLGRAPRVLMWPYGEYTQVSDAISASVGMPVTFTLGEHPRSSTTRLQAIPRLLISGNISAGDLSWELQHLERKDIIRAVQVDLDYVYDRNQEQQEHNLNALIDRICTLRPTQVWLQAFADPDGDDAADAVYFPNRFLPVRADLFSRAAWQLRTRCNVEVYSWMPVLAWHLPDAKLQARLEIQSTSGDKPEKPVRLNPFLPETREIVGGLYEDMARSAPITGILYHDDAVLRDTDALGQKAPAPGPERTRALIAFTQELTSRVQIWRPELQTARNIFAEPVLHPESETWYAQSLPLFMSSYTEVALMAMPQMENAKDPSSWLRELARKVERTTNGFDNTVFELQTVDWNTQRPIPTDAITQQVRFLQSLGVRHLAYYPDDFVENHPSVQTLRPAFSASDFPTLQP
jgi:poly-beta-1,6-N-acetyl-D-glucosamine N-deacetylase